MKITFQVQVEIPDGMTIPSDRQAVIRDEIACQTSEMFREEATRQFKAKHDFPCKVTHTKTERA